MSQLLERGLRRQKAIQESRTVAWIGFLIMLPAAFFSSVSLLVALEAGTFLSVGSIVSVLVAISATWIAAHLLREARRLGKLLKDPGLLMRAKRDPELVEGIHWSVLNPFSGWRD